MNRASKTFLLLLTFALPAAMGSVLLCLSFKSNLFKPLPSLNRQQQLNRDLITAIHDQNTRAVMDLLKKGADPGARGYWDRNGQWDEARHQRVWEPDRNTGGPTALMLAVFAGRIETVQALLAAGINVNVRDKEGNTALMYAGLYGNINASALLLDYGADLRPNNYGEVPLYYAVDIGSAGLVRRFLARGAKVNARDHRGDTPLLTAASVADAPMVRLLLEEGAAVNVQNNQGETALLLAVEAHGGADYEGNDVKDRMHVSSAQKIDTVLALLEKGADRTIQDHKGRTALKAAREPSLSEIMHLLKTVGTRK